MKKILEQLYQGELHPCAKCQLTLEQLKTGRDKAFHSYSAFLEKLPEELVEEFVNLMDGYLRLFPLELEQNFIEGFRMGARMMAEVYSASDEKSA